MDEYRKERSKRKERNIKQKEVVVGVGTVGLLCVKFKRRKGKEEGKMYILSERYKQKEM